MKHTINTKAYELSNHLGNVLVTVSDARQVLNSGSSVSGYMAIVKSATDYSAFGAQMPGRTYSSASYRYGFNGQENDVELGNGVTTAEFWEYDGKLGRRWNRDPVVKQWESPYATFGNSPISVSDPNGDTGGNPATSEAPQEEGQDQNGNGCTCGCQTQPQTFPIPQGGSLTPQSNEQNQQVGTQAVMTFIDDKIGTITDGENSIDDIKSGGDVSWEEGHSTAYNSVNDNVDNAWTGGSDIWSGEVAEDWDDDDISIQVEVQIVSVDGVVLEQSPNQAPEVTKTNSQNSNTTVTGGTQINGGVQRKSGETTVNAGVTKSSQVSQTAWSGNQTQVVNAQNVYNVTYRVKVTIYYDDDAWGGGDSGKTYTYYTDMPKGHYLRQHRLQLHQNN